MIVLTQDGPCNFSTDDHQNSEQQLPEHICRPPPPASGYRQLPGTSGEIFQAPVFPISVTPEMIK